MKAKNIIFYAVWLFILTIFQPTLIQWIALWGISPNMFLIFVIVTGFLKGKKAGAICGAVFGLVFDLLVGRLIGISGILFMYIGFGVGIVTERFLSSTGSVAAAVLTFGLALLYAVGYYIAYSMSIGDMGLFYAVIRIILPECLYTAILSLVLFLPIRKSFAIISNYRRY